MYSGRRRYSTDERLAEDLVMLTVPDSPPPICPKKIAAARGAVVRYSDDSDDMSDAIGWYRRSGADGRPEIIIARGMILSRERFTIAHELGHHELGHNNRPRDTVAAMSSDTISIEEVRANRFAAALLMPSMMLHDCIDRLGISDVGQLARKFEVSPAAMLYRLKNLGLVS